MIQRIIAIVMRRSSIPSIMATFDSAITNLDSLAEIEGETAASHSETYDKLEGKLEDAGDKWEQALDRQIEAQDMARRLRDMFGYDVT